MKTEEIQWGQFTSQPLLYLCVGEKTKENLWMDMVQNFEWF